MTTALRRPEPVTIDAFDAFVEAQADTTLFELVEGVIVMMTNPTEVHEQIAGNIGAPLKLAMDARGCRTYQGGMRVQRSDDPRDTDKTRPDVVVRCGRWARRPTSPTRWSWSKCSRPRRSTSIAGRSSISTSRSRPIRHIAFIYQDQMRVEHYRRGEQGFELEVFTQPGRVASLRSGRISHRSRPHLLRRDDLGRRRTASLMLERLEDRHSDPRLRRRRAVRGAACASGQPGARHHGRHQGPARQVRLHAHGAGRLQRRAQSRRLRRAPFHGHHRGRQVAARPGDGLDAGRPRPSSACTSWRTRSAASSTATPTARCTARPSPARPSTAPCTRATSPASRSSTG